MSADGTPRFDTSTKGASVLYYTYDATNPKVEIKALGSLKGAMSGLTTSLTLLAAILHLSFN